MMSSADNGVHHAEDYEEKNGGQRTQAAIDEAEAAPGPNVIMVGPVGPDAQVQSLNVSGLRIDGYKAGVIIAEGMRGEDLRFEGVTMRNVATPWAINDVDQVLGDVILNRR